MKLILVGLIFNLLSLSDLGAFIIPDDKDVHRVWNQFLEFPENPSHFNLLVWNIKKLELKKAKDDLVSLAQINDLLLIQEFASSRLLEDYWQSYNKHRIDFSISFLKENVYQTGVANISNLVMDQFYWVRSKGVEPFVFTPKMSNVAIFNINNIKLMIVNIHFINFVRDDQYVAEMNRMEKILSTHEGPLIFAGDFNCWNKYRKNKLDDLVRKLDLKYVVFPQRDKLVWGIVDHVLYRGVRIVGPQVLLNYYSSDHKPLMMKVIVD